MTLSLDSQAILLLCSHLGLSSSPEFAPFTLKDWNPLAKKLQSLSMRPASLLGLSSELIQSQIGLSDEESERISHLLQRSGSLAIELERFASLGIQVLTRADPDYPARYRQRLKESAPSVLFFAGEKALLGQPGIAVVGSRHLDEAGQACAEFVGNACGISGLVLYSGGAKGVDTLSMNAALAASRDSRRHPGGQSGKDNPRSGKSGQQSAEVIYVWQPLIPPVRLFRWAQPWAATS